MALPKDVQGAVDSLECEIADPEDCTAWQTIRAHLLSQDAELADYKNASLHAADDCTAKDAEIERLRGVVGETAQMAEDADCRLAAANALLREVYDHGENMALHEKIDAHLSENTHG